MYLLQCPILRLADVLREMDCLLVIRVESTGTGTTSSPEVTGAALSITTNKKDEVSAVNRLDSIDLALKMTF